MREYDTRVVPANETLITVRTTLTFLLILIGSYFQGLELLHPIKDRVDLLESVNYNNTTL